MTMNLRLYLMRHAEAENANIKEDILRILTENGKAQAKVSGQFLNDYQVDKIIVSFAKRTMQTSSIVQEIIDDTEIEIVEELYQCNEQAVVNLIMAEPDQHKHLLIIGHNPVIHNVALSLTNSDSNEYDQLATGGMSPAQLVVIDFHEIANWQHLLEEKGKIIEIFKP